MAWTIDYNGVGSTTSEWSQIKIQSYRAIAQYAEDGLTHQTTRHEMEGTAVVTAATAAAFTTDIVTLKATLARQGKRLTIKNGAATFIDINGEASDQDEALGTPFVDFRIMEIDGALTAIVGFKIVWTDYDVLASEDDSFHIQSHWWTQEFERGEDGNTRLTVNGWLRVRADVNESPVSVKRGPNPDAYRSLVTPDLPEGFRLERDRWATDAMAQQLVYSVTYRSATRNLPAPALKGEGSFEWKRSMIAGPGMLGEKVFDAVLEGDRLSSPTSMLGQLAACAANRIKFAGQFADQILELAVIEDDIFNANRIGLRIVARGTGGDVERPFEYRSNQQALLDDITQGTLPYEQPDPHGDALIRSVRRTLFNPLGDYDEASFPVAQTEASNFPGSDTYQVAAFPTNQGTLEFVPKGLDRPTQDHLKHPYNYVRVSERIRVKTSMVTLQSQSLGGEDYPYQTRRPQIFLISEYTFSRQNRAPEQFFLNPPAGTILVNQEWHVQPGVVDANNNRAFVAVYTRVLQLIDRNQNAQWVVENANIPGLGTVNFYRWRLPNGLIGFPQDPRVDTLLGTRTLFEETVPDYDVFVRLEEKYYNP